MNLGTGHKARKGKILSCPLILNYCNLYLQFLAFPSWYLLNHEALAVNGKPSILHAAHMSVQVIKNPAAHYVNQPTHHS